MQASTAAAKMQLLSATIKDHAGNTVYSVRVMLHHASYRSEEEERWGGSFALKVGEVLEVGGATVRLADGRCGAAVINRIIVTSSGALMGEFGGSGPLA